MGVKRITVKDITGLTPEHVNFVIEYVKDFAPRRAAEASGLDPDKGEGLVNSPKISAAIKHILSQRLDASHIDAEWVLMEAVDNHHIARQLGKLSASNTALNLVAKHVMVDAFAAEKVEVSTDKDVVDRLLRARKRMTPPPPEPVDPSIPVVEGCGGCHQHGNNPTFNNGKCTICKRTQAQVTHDHGFLNLAPVEAPTEPVVSFF